MKRHFTPIMIGAAICTTILATSCGGGEKPKEEPKKDTAAVVEEPAPLPTEYNGYAVTEVEFPATVYVIKRETISQEKVGEFFDKNMGAAFGAATKAGHTPAGPGTGIYWTWDDSTKTSDMAVAVPVTPKGDIKMKGYERFDVPASKALLLEYNGNYDKMMDAHGALGMYMADRQLENDFVIEEYVVGANEEKDTTKWQTKIYYILK
jgi:hypothetical protein